MSEEDLKNDDGSLTPDQVAEEAKAEEEFLSAPEDTVNPLVPEEKKEDVPDGTISSADVSETEPAASDENLVSNEQTVLSGAPAAEPVAASEAENPAATATVEQSVNMPAKKKSHKGLIITLCIVFVLLLGGGAAALIFGLSYGSPERYLSDAMNKVFSAENISLTASQEASSETPNVKNTTILDCDSEDADCITEEESSKCISGTSKDGSSKCITPDTLPTMTTSAFSGDFELAKGKDGVKLSYSMKDSSSSKEMGVSGVLLKDGDLYFKATGLSNASSIITQILTMISSATSLKNLSTSSSSMIGSVVASLLEKIDDNWYMVKLSELGKDSECASKNIDKILSKDMKDFFDVYKENEFIELDKDAKVEEKDGVKLITVKFNYDKFKSFMEAVNNKVGVEKCSEESGSNDSNYEQMFKQYFGEDGKIKLGIRPWSHELASIEASDLSIKVKYDKVDISAPSSAKSLDDLKSDVREGIVDATYKALYDYCESSLKSYGKAYVDQCKQMIKERYGSQIDKITVEDFLSGKNSISL